MSSLLWLRQNDKNYYYSNKSCIGDLNGTDVEMKILGSAWTIKSTLQAHSYAQAFSVKKILENPLAWAARFIFLERELKIEMLSEHMFLSYLLDSTDPNTWINNLEFIKLLNECLIKYSAKL